MPALVVVAEVTDGRADGFLAVVTLGHRLHALVTVEISVHREILLSAKILAASLADKALLVPALPLGGDLPGAGSDRLSALLAFVCIFVEASFTDDSLLYHAKYFAID